ncbi:hypothetical protein SAMN03159290_05862 [Pseudomonas sp. NFACC13-1]|nr:hypothetical protein SAMN03159290_05862 [Pseudomonas sp. NFACC13-1]
MKPTRQLIRIHYDIGPCEHCLIAQASAELLDWADLALAMRLT